MIQIQWIWLNISTSYCIRKIKNASQTGLETRGAGVVARPKISLCEGNRQIDQLPSTLAGSTRVACHAG